MGGHNVNEYIRQLSIHRQQPSIIQSRAKYLKGYLSLLQWLLGPDGKSDTSGQKNLFLSDVCI